MLVSLVFSSIQLSVDLQFETGFVEDLAGKPILQKQSVFLIGRRGIVLIVSGFKTKH